MDDVEPFTSSNLKTDISSQVYMHQKQTLCDDCTACFVEQPNSSIVKTVVRETR